MNRLFGITIMALGAILLYYGYNEISSPVGELTEALTGSPPDRSIAKMIGGVLLIVVGGGTLFYRAK